MHWKARAPPQRRAECARLRGSAACADALAHTTRPHTSPQTGEICLDILKSAWSPAWTLQSVCRAILSLLAHAAPDSPLNCDAGNLLRAGDLVGYNAMARCYTVEYAMGRGGAAKRGAGGTTSAAR